jgi:hypothetical protein
MELKIEGREVSFSQPEFARIRIPFHIKEPHQVIYLARLIAHLKYEEIHFRGARLWINVWGVWDPLEEAIAFKVLEQFRRSYGESRSLELAPAMYFRHDEFVESVCCLLQPMLMGWDAYYVPTWAYGHLDYFLFVSHDGFVDIAVSTKEMNDEVREVLRAHNWIDALITRQPLAGPKSQET